MAKLTEGTNLTGTVTLVKQSGTEVTLDTAQSYTPKNIVLTINATPVAPTFTNPAPTGDSTAVSGQVTMDTTSTGCGIEIQTKYSVNATPFTYNGDYNGWINKSTGAAAGSTAAVTDATGTKYYVTKVTVPVNKLFTVETNADSDLDETSDLDIINNANRRVDVTNNAYGVTWVHGAGTTLFNSGSSTTGALSVQAYNSGGSSLIGEQTIVSGGRWVTTNVAAAGTYYGCVVVSNGTITNPSSGGTSSGQIARGSQIKIGKGFYPNDLYYTAQSNNGTLTIDTTKNAGINHSCDGYDQVRVTGINLPNSSTFTIKVPNGAGSTMNFVFTVDASGNVTITES